MSHKYNVRYSEIIVQAGKTWHDLPDNLKWVIGYFIVARQAWEAADEPTQERLLPILVQADAVISAAIYRLYFPVSEDDKLDKLKLLSLRAKALRLKNNGDT